MDMHNIGSLIVAAGIGIAAQQAAAVVTFQFDDNPDPNGQFIYEGPDVAGELGLLFYNSQVPVDLAVDATGEGGSEFVYTDAIFSFVADVGAIFDGPFPSTWFAPLTNGFMEFRTSGGDLLFNGAFGSDNLPAFLSIVVNTGSINVSLEVGGLNYVPGQTLLDDLSADIGSPVEGFLPPFDAVWTLTNLPNLTTSVPPGAQPGPNAAFLDDFAANSSFSGTTGLRIIPAPGAGAIAAIGLAGLGIRRRR
jgi:hypothetical protein